MTEKFRSVLIVSAVTTLLVVIVALARPDSHSKPTIERGVFTGVWSMSFETSSFTEGLTYEGSIEDSIRSEMGARYGWLEVGGHPGIPFCKLDDGPWVQEAYYITFEGERIEGPAGHLGQYPALYIVRNIKHIRPIPGLCDDLKDLPAVEP